MEKAKQYFCAKPNGKLHYPHTILTGFGFLASSIAWAIYDPYITKILNHLLNNSATITSWSAKLNAAFPALAEFAAANGEDVTTAAGGITLVPLFIGIIMTFDNIFGVIFQPTFGKLSDNTHSRFGKRRPYVIFGAPISAILFAIIPIVAIKVGSLPLTMLFIILFVFVMSLWRAPVVALMPDLTPSDIRSEGNAVINLMGTAGGILVLAIGMAFATSSVRNSLMSYTAYFAVIAGIMLVALLIFRLTVNEPKFVAEMQADSKRFSIDNGDSDDAPAGSGKLGKAERRSLIFLLLSIVLWFFGYNAVTSKYSVYASNILHKDYNLTLMLAQAAAIVAYLPVGIVASKIGRKKTILGGVVMLAVAFGVAAFLNAESPTMLMNAMFCLAGIGWATINVNSFPMVVEMCSGSDVGRYTGFYYTASMAAQVVTPMFSGFLMDKLGMTVLFPYAAIFVAGAFVTMLFVRHGDSRPIPAKGLEALDVDD